MDRNLAPAVILAVQYAQGGDNCSTGLVKKLYGVTNLDLISMYIRVGPQDEKSSNLRITADSTGSIHKNVSGKKFDSKKSSFRVWGFDLKIWELGIFSDICTFFFSGKKSNLY